MPLERNYWLVDVAVPVPLRQTFTYKIPEDIEHGSVRAGHRVLVPFRAKLLHGVTMTDAYAVEKIEPRTRAIASYDAVQRILAPDIRDLIEWMVRYYKAPVGETVKMALPPGMLSEKEILFRLTQAGAEETDESRVLSLLSGKALTKKAWETLAQTEILFRDIRRWEDLGYLEITRKGAERESIPHTSVYLLSESGKVMAPDRLRSLKQRALLAWFLARPNQYVAPTEVNAEFKNGSALAERMVKKDLLLKLRVPKHELEHRAADHEPDEIKILTSEQKTALDALLVSLGEQKFQAFLMFGVTGSGKTEVYLRAIQDCLTRGRQALFLVPEIGLTPLMQRRIIERFGERLAILHSAIGAGRRAESWARILAGKVDVVLGARSGIFAPLPRLGLVIVDEEHDQSYKQNDGIRYQARDLALVRAKMSDSVVVLGSATPSLESWLNYERGRSHLLTLEKRATRAPLPAVQIVDLRQEFRDQRRRPILSAPLEAAMDAALGQGRQVMILLNRRGYHAFMLCRKCGETVMCDQCEVSLTYHRTDHSLKCHYCGTSKSVPESCPSCKTPAAMMQFFGEGTQQIQEVIQKRFPDYVVDRLDRDRLSNKNAHHQILAAFEANQTQILVGTQMIAKGHDFPNVTLVGILNADIGLRIPDFRAAENVFQLVTQVAGRSGRGRHPGSVIIQTYMPEHYAIVFASSHDFLGFLAKEMRYRKHLFYAPFAHMVSLLITHKDHERTNQVSFWMAAQLDRFRERGKLVVLGPAKAPISKIKGAYRYQIVLKSTDRSLLHRIADTVIEETVRRGMLPRPAIIMDIDPYQFF